MISRSQKSSIRSPLDHGDLGAEGGEHRGVLDADDPRADDDHRRRQVLHAEDLVAVHNGQPVELHAGRAGRPGADGDHHLLRGDLPFGALLGGHHDGVRVVEPAGADQHVHVVAGQLAADDVDFPTDHVVGAGEQVGDRDLFLQPVRLPVELALGVTGDVEHRFPERLRRDRTGVDAHATDHVPPLHQADPPAELGTGNRRLLPARPGTENKQVEVVPRHRRHLVCEFDATRSTHPALPEPGDASPAAAGRGCGAYNVSAPGPLRRA
jgi:hypothetical protein